MTSPEEGIVAKLPNYEAWKGPWEASGEEFDAERAKRHIYNLMQDKERRDERIVSLTVERDAAADELAVLKAKSGSKEGQFDADRYRLELAIDHRLSRSEAKRLVGTTKEELDADVPELLKSLGRKVDGDKGGEGGSGKTGGNEQGGEAPPVRDQFGNRNPFRSSRQTGQEPPASERETAVETNPAKLESLFK